jgi:hypothetical protein
MEIAVSDVEGDLISVLDRLAQEIGQRGGPSS